LICRTSTSTLTLSRHGKLSLDQTNCYTILVT
jgi:hypothetical protein